MPKIITVDFYRVELSGGDSFQQSMTAIQALALNEARNMHFQDMPVRIRQITRHNQNWHGDMMRTWGVPKSRASASRPWTPSTNL